MVLTTEQIIDLAMLAGLPVSKEMAGQDMLVETKITIMENEEGKYAYYTEYPEEGIVALG